MTVANIRINKTAFVSIVLLFVMSIMLIGQGMVSAAVFNRLERRGYFYNNFHGYNGSKLDSAGIEHINNVDQFVNYYWSEVTSTNTKKNTAGSFTVLLMLGAAPGTPKSQAKTRFSEWEGRVRAYAAAGRINFNYSYVYTENTRYNPGFADVDWYPSSGTQNSIVFTNPDGSQFAIKKNCANPVGQAAPLVSLNRNPTVNRSINCSTFTITVNDPDDHLHNIAVYVDHKRNDSKPNDNYIYGESNQPSGTVHSVDIKKYTGSSNRRFYVYVRDHGNPSVLIYIGQNSVGSCPTYWNYTHDSFTQSPSPGSIRKPDATITLSNRIKNTGDGTGRKYTQQIQRRVGSGGWSVIKTWADLGGLNSGSSRTRTTTNTVPEAPHETQICYRGRISPFAGQSTPSSTTTSSGWRYSGQTCIEVYNRRFNLTATVTSNNPHPSPGDTVEFIYSVCNTEPVPSPATGGVAPSVNIHTNNSDPEVNPGINITRNINRGSPNCWEVNRDITIPITAPPGDEFCTRLFGNRNVGYSDGTGLSGTVSAESCVLVVAKPYFRVYNGDASAGIEDPAGCSTHWGHDSSATIQAFNSGNGKGSGVQLAAFAIGTIDKFTSATGRSSPGPPRGLTFANTTGSYGGGWKGSCPYDYIANYNDLAGVSDHPDGFTIGSTLSGVHHVDGDAIINADITTYNGSWDIDNIPSFTLIADGNIYINHEVNRLDGVYVAGGNIYTCTFDTSPARMPTVEELANDAINNCKHDDNTSDVNKLTVNGAFIANNIKLQRSGGNVSTNSSPTEPSDDPTIAEVFIFNPAVWLSAPTVDASSVSPYESITSLPPVL